MQAVRVETIVGENGEIRLSQLPFQAGDPVEVIVRSRVPASAAGLAFPLRGVPITYERPTDPVAAEDWDALR